MQSAISQKRVKQKDGADNVEQSRESAHEDRQVLGTEVGMPIFLKPNSDSAPVLGAADDEFEREADQVAAAVVGGTRVNAPGVRKRLPRNRVVQTQRGRVACQANPDGKSHSPSSAVRHALNNADDGAPIEPGVRKRIETQLGEDLTDVRVQAGKQSEHANSVLNSRAFTHGNRIWLGPGESQSDLGLMAHEATHVVQQRKSTDAPGMQRQTIPGATTSDPSDTDDEIEISLADNANDNDGEATSGQLDQSETEMPEDLSSSEDTQDETSETRDSDTEDDTSSPEHANEGEEEESEEEESQDEEESSGGSGDSRLDGSEGDGTELPEGSEDSGSTGHALVDFELAEHERWAGSFGEVGTAGSDERAQFIIDQAGQGVTSGATGALGMGFLMGAVGGAIGQIAGRRLATLAVSRGAMIGPVPGLGPAIGGVMAVAGLAMRDWGATADTISRFGEGEGYEGLANDLEAVAEALDVATQVMDVLAGVLGGIAVGMWVGAVLSAGTLSPLAATLSAIATGIGLATTAVGLIISAVVRPVVVALRALHTFESQGDPTQIEAEGQQLQAAAGQVSGAVAGAAAGRLGGAAGGRGGRRADSAVARWQANRAGGAPSMSANAGPGPRIHAEMPEAPASSSPSSLSSTVVSPPVSAHSPAAQRPAGSGPVAAAPPTGRRRPRASSNRPVSERTHDSSLRERRSVAERNTEVEFTAEETRSLDIRETMGETIGERTAMSRTGAVEPEIAAVPARDTADSTRLRSGDQRAWSHPDGRIDQQRVERSLRTEARRESRGDMQRAAQDMSQHTSATQEAMTHMTPDQIAHLAETGQLPEGYQFHHRLTVRDFPEHAHQSAAGIHVSEGVHAYQEHGGSSRAPIELAGPRRPDAGSEAGFTSDRQAKPRTRATHDEIARGSRSSGDVDADITIQQGRQDRRSTRFITRAIEQKQSALAALRQNQAESPTPARQRQIDRLEGEIAATRQFLEDPASITSSSGASSTTTSSGPAASSPAARSSAAPTSSIPSHTETARTSTRADAMAQYHQQIAADPGRESGVWRGEDGTYYVMQGDSGSVAPPAAAGRLELVYHSHPTHTDANMQGLVSQPSQAAGDFGVLQHQHGQGPVGARQSSELHFPTYDDAGTQTGYGATRFGYDPTNPLPLQVQTTLPGGRPSTQRYASFADFEARTGIRAGGATPLDSHAARVAADAQLSADVAGAQQRIGDLEAGTFRTFEGRGGVRPGTLGERIGREEAREATTENAEAQANRPQLGPAYTTEVAGLSPGESMEIPINPAYPEPPGTPAELALLRARIADTQQAQQDLRATERSTAAQVEQERTHQGQLEESAGVAEGLAEGRSNHQSATDDTQSTNSEQQSTAGEAISTLGQTAEHAAALTTLVGSLRMFQGMANLFSYLPGSLGRDAERASADADGLITSLNRVSETESTQGNVEAGLSTMEANQTRIESISSQGAETDTELTSGQEGIVALQTANDASLAETESVQQQATEERQQARSEEEQAQASHDSLESQLQTWAEEHRQAREDAISAAIENMEAQGYRATEVN